MDWHTCSAVAARKYWRSEISIKHQYYCAALAWQAYNNQLVFLTPKMGTGYLKL